MFRDTVLTIFEDIWPMILICCVIIISLRIVDLIINKKSFIFYKEMLWLGFILYVICLFRVVTFQDVSWSSSNLIPFREMLRYDIGSKLFYRNVVGNMLIFIPYGFFVSYFLKLKKISINFLLTFLVSITIEITQYKIGRVFDIDDIVLNIIGSMIGFYIFFFISKMKKRLPDLLQKPFVYNIIMVVILVFISLYLIGVFYV